ncbi:hypothetical protein Vadar_034539 [Vaccinium darrowii]|uniref:Uncharacterized protein n=1 Tax=Vaccinium darrowii TaxID=229202 RepID=A0ACB7ZHC7_9ERIC|nr:hypothetical protein Vadar_034539 [Vaccinium darrowii]
MGKHARRELDDELFDDHNPGCTWGIIHALHYHHWQSTAKKMLSHKKHNGPRHTKGVFGLRGNKARAVICSTEIKTAS